MIKQNFMEKLLDGVEIIWTVIGDDRFVEIANSNRKPVKASLRKPGKTPYFGANNIQDYVEGYTHDGVFILIAEDGSASLENYSIQWATGKFWANNHVHVLRGKGELDSRFLYHYLKTINFIPFLSGGGRAKLTKSKLVEIPIPCPENSEKSLEIQGEIVRILDTFTELTEELTAELTAELIARKKQYTFYRDKLFAFEEGEVEWKPTIEVGELIRGNGLPKTDFTDVGVPAIHYGQIYTYYGTYTTETISFVSPETAKKLRKVEHGDVVITNTSENLEDVGKAVVYLGEVQAVTGGHATIFKPSQKISGKYFAYFTQTEMFAKQKRKYAKGTKVIDVSATDMAKIKIPIPYPNDQAKSLEEQNRIISILDKFDSLISSITEDLPREIELRQKQYEYYRNMLLSFPKEEVEK